MAGNMKKRITSRRKLLTLRSLTNSKSVRKDSIILDAFFYIYHLKLKFEAMKREYSTLTTIKEEYLRLIKPIHLPQEVKVERDGEKYIVKVTCNKAQDNLVSILEAFEEMGLSVLQARVSCNSFFAMDAIAEAQYERGKSHLDVREVTQALYKAIQTKSEKAPCENLEVPVISNSR